jgi:hypothetical protein
MTWVRIDDQFPDHPKVIQAGPMASWLYVCGLAYANRYLTDGFIPDRQAVRLVDTDDSEPLVRRLVDTGLWERVEGGYQIHDYLEYQPSSEKVKAERAASAERQARWRERNAVSNDDSNGVTNEGSNALVTPTPNPNPSHSRPTPVPSPKNPAKESAKAHALADDPDRFEQFWPEYPRKTAKEDARKAFTKLNPNAELFDVMMAALRDQKTWPQWQDGVIPHPATWINGKRWTDERPTARASPNGNRNGSDDSALAYFRSESEKRVST